MLRVRDATAADAAACAAISAPYVTGTAVTFETEARDSDAMAERIAGAQRRHAGLVAEDEQAVVGYAYAGALRPRPAYAASCETTVYLRPGLRRTGAGRALMEALLARLAQQGFRRALAAVALPNDASVGRHRALGFREAGVWERVGRKLDAEWDVAWFQRDL